MPSFEKPSSAAPLEKDRTLEEADTSFADLAEGKLYEEPRVPAPEQLPGADAGTLEEVRARLAEHAIKDEAPVLDAAQVETNPSSGERAEASTAERSAERGPEERESAEKALLQKAERGQKRPLLGQEKLSIEKQTERALDWQVLRNTETRKKITAVSAVTALAALVGGMAAIPANLNDVLLASGGPTMLMGGFGLAVGILGAGLLGRIGTYAYQKFGKQRAQQSEFKKLYGRAPRGLHLPGGLRS
jgi:hypothetical protein